MIEIEPPDWKLIERVATGRASATEWAAIDEWVGDDRRRRAFVDDIRRIVRTARALPQPTFDAQTSLPRLRAFTDGELPAVLLSARSGPSMSWWWSRAAAVLAFLAVSIGIVSHLTRRSGAGQRDRTYTTARGERAHIVLADGSRVMLAPESRLTLGPSFGDGARAVTLDGEAFFSVEHDAAKPFVVRTARVVITDLGTRFDVQAYGADSAVAVGVTDGRVSLTMTAPVLRAVTLTAGDLGTMSAGRPFILEHHAGDRLDVWTSGRLEFRKTPLRDVLRAIDRWYGVRVQLGDAALGSRPLTASFGDESITEILLVITRSTLTRVVQTSSATLLVNAAQTEH